MRLALVETAAPPVYPLPAEAHLGQFHAINWSPHDWLGSRFRALASPAAKAAWLDLFCESLVTQKPGGTLPTDDAELAALARLSRERWAELRVEALMGWAPVRVLTADGRDAGLRLAHPRVTAEAERLWSAVEDAGEIRAANRAYQAHRRIRKALVAAGAKQMCGRETVAAIHAELERAGVKRATVAVILRAAERVSMTRGP